MHYNNGCVTYELSLARTQSALLDHSSTEHVHNMKSTLDHYSLTIDDQAW